MRGLKLGEGGLEEAETARLPDTAEHITRTERRAAAAEREAVERYLTLHMASRVGGMFEARISGVTRFGLFVTLTENGAGDSCRPHPCRTINGPTRKPRAGFPAATRACPSAWDSPWRCA
ncbi:hypothetical protein [Teichococcus aestuarii]|uniref:hypothetical protein n=1 Tax=Teichococcus aestuarii TaxID=568898 RepID=UPI003607AFFD